MNRVTRIYAYTFLIEKFWAVIIQTLMDASQYAVVYVLFHFVYLYICVHICIHTFILSVDYVSSDILAPAKLLAIRCPPSSTIP